ncbi:hypothetical protein ACCO45_004499, partial [Purpureocillium lilacinum]
MTISSLFGHFTLVVAQCLLWMSLPVLLAYTSSRISLHRRLGADGDVQEPMTPSFCLPYLGHALHFELNSETYIRRICLFDALLLFGLPPVDHGIFDRSLWCGPSKLSDSDSDPSRQIMSLQRRDFSFYYQGNNLGLIMQRLSVNLRRELSEGCGDNGWTFMPDLYSFLLTATFRAIVEALYGEHILRVCPSLAQDFWQFYAAMPTIAKGFPEWLSPTAYKSRRNMIINFSNWRSWCAKHFDPKTVPVNYEYEPIWGTLLVRRMVERYQELGFSNEGVSSALLGFLFVYVTQSSTGIWRLAIDKPSTVANSIPAAVWMVLHILLSPGLQSRLDPGFNAAFNRNSGSMQIDKLLGMPLLNSIYCETLRLHAAGTIGRKSTSDFELPGVGQFVTAPQLFLSDGTPKHPLDKFWAERFLLYKDDPISGPFRQPAYLRQGSLPIPEASEKRDRDAKLVTSGLHDADHPAPEPLAAPVAAAPGALPFCTILSMAAPGASPFCTILSMGQGLHDSLSRGDTDSFFPPATTVLQRQLSSSDNCPPATTVLQRHLCSRDTFAPATTVLQRHLSSTDNCPPPTTVLHRHLSSTDTCPPPTPVLHRHLSSTDTFAQRHLCSSDNCPPATTVLQRQLSSSDNCPPATPALQRTCALATPVQPEFVHHYWPEWNPRNASVICTSRQQVATGIIDRSNTSTVAKYILSARTGLSITRKLATLAWRYVSSPRSGRMAKHCGSTHYQCDTCAQVFLIKERKQHEYGTSHDHYIVLNPVNLERGVADLADLTELSASDLAMPTDSVGTANMRKKYDDLVRSLLRECLTSTGPALHNGTRWSRCLQQLRKILPADCEIPFARITTFPDMSDNNADVWYVTEDSMMQHFVNEDFVLRKPVVIKSQRSRAWECSSHSFLKDLGDHFAGSTVDVQDLTTTEKTAVKMGVDAVIKKIGEGADVPTGRLPINLLNLKYFGQSPPTPRFLNLSRFNVLPSISSHLEAEFSGAAIAGKRSRATAREVDLERSLIFSLFAQRGSFTGFHVDCPDGTWVCPEWGLKLWIFATSTDEADMVKFAEEGDEWAP